MKVCWSCKEEKQESLFCTVKGKAITFCRSCAAARSRKYYANVKAPSIPGLPERRKANEFERAQRALARASGQIKYQSAKTCVHGHINPMRLLLSQQCCQCWVVRKHSKDRTEAFSKKRRAYKRKVARNLGQTRYKTGDPCIRGHISERLVSTGQCCACLAARPKKAAIRKATPEELARRSARKRSRAGKVVQRGYYKSVLSKCVKHRVTAFMRQCLRRCFIAKNHSRTVDLLGYHPDTLMGSLESQFLDGMSWDNYGDWHIDHKKPISAFIAEGISDPMVVNAIENLRPLWAFDNLSKGSRHEL